MPSSDEYQNEALSGKFQINNVWGQSSPTGIEEELTTPSGQTCRAKKMSIEAMIAAGVLADTDALTAQVSKHVRKVKGAKGKADGTEVDNAAILKDGESIKAMIALVDKVMPHVVISPIVKLHYTTRTVGSTTVTKKIEADDREDGVIYTDQIDFQDKMWLFDWAAGGLSAMLAFRQ